MCCAWTYYICTEWSEGVSPTHVEVSGVEPLEEADVIVTLGLEEKSKTTEKMILQWGEWIWNQTEKKMKRKRKREKTKWNLVVFSLEKTLAFLLGGGLPLDLEHTT